MLDRYNRKTIIQTYGFFDLKRLYKILQEYSLTAKLLSDFDLLNEVVSACSQFINFHSPLCHSDCLYILFLCFLFSSAYLSSIWHCSVRGMNLIVLISDAL